MKPTNKAAHFTLIILSFTWIVYFAQWWFRTDHVPTTLLGTWGHATDVFLFILVSYVVWYPIIMQAFSWILSTHIKQLQNQEPSSGMRVAFITTFVPQSESMELLHKCLPAMVAADYPHDTWLLDEGDSAEARELCVELGVKHYSRHGKDQYNESSGKFKRKTKGGNHNSWYDQFGDKYDYVAQLDTDFIPASDFLTKTLGYFSDKSIGFVGTPQIYGNTNESFIAKGAAEQAFNFYGPILRGLSGIQSSLMIGANHVVRVAALRDVGYYSAHITEDVLTGMKLHAKGWKSVYVPEVLAVGEGPETWRAYFIQQMRWAYGSMDVLLRHSDRLLAQMSFDRACYYLLLLQYYFSGLAMTLGLLGLGLYAIFGITVARISLLHFVEYYGPVVLICELMSLFLQQYNIRAKQERGVLLAGRIMSLAAWPCFFIAFISVVTGKRLTYHVTPKGDHTPNKTPLSLFAAHLTIAAYCIVCIALSFIDHHISVVILFWLALSAVVMLGIPLLEPMLHAMRKPADSKPAAPSHPAKVKAGQSR